MDNAVKQTLCARLSERRTAAFRVGLLEGYLAVGKITQREFQDLLSQVKQRVAKPKPTEDLHSQIRILDAELQQMRQFLAVKDRLNMDRCARIAALETQLAAAQKQVQKLRTKKGIS